MFEKNLGIAFLLDFYGDVLNEHMRSALYLYYEEDLSLSEIADSMGISRQGVRHIIKKGEEELSYLEDRLGLADRFRKISDAVEELSDTANAMISSGDEQLKRYGTKISVCVKKISDGNS